MIGQTINNYILERKLGEGGMGAVYFARHNCIDRVVAIKVLHKTLFTQTNIRNRFKNEANALIKLGHPNIVKIYDYVEQDEIACLIMEYIEGVTLDDYITKVTGPLPAPRATHIINSVLDAVQYAHDKNIFHRDIKPGNIMVSKDGKNVKIMDFGIAKFTDASNLKTTHANAQLGTPFYMSPEQVKGMPYTALSDIYSLGVTLFEMVTGKCPYQEITNLFELQSKIINEILPPTSKYYPDVTPKIQKAIKIATNKIPEQRFKSCNEFKSYLLEIEKPQPEPVQKQTQQKIQPVPIQKQTPQKQASLKQTVVQQPKPETRRPQPVKLQEVFEEKKKNNSWIYLLVLLSILILGVIAYSSINQSNSHPRPSGVTAKSTSAKVVAKPVVITKRHDIISPAVTVNDPKAPKVNETENKTKINIERLSEHRRQKKHKKTDTLFSKRKPKPKPEPKVLPTPAFQNVRNDLMNYLAERKTFGGIQYDSIGEIKIKSVSYKGSDAAGSRGYDLNITINGEDLNCRVVYKLNVNEPRIKALK